MTTNLFFCIKILKVVKHKDIFMIGGIVIYGE